MSRGLMSFRVSYCLELADQLLHLLFFLFPFHSIERRREQSGRLVIIGLWVKFRDQENERKAQPKQTRFGAADIFIY